jgi:DNA-directed RNA polymerase subunit RPC12/RpoP
MHKCKLVLIYSMSQEPSKEELTSRLEYMEKKYNDIIMAMEKRHKEDIQNILKHINEDPTVQCSSCGSNIILMPTTYWNVQDTDIKCKECGALMRITLERGELKKSTLVEPGKSDRRSGLKGM